MYHEPPRLVQRLAEAFHARGNQVIIAGQRSIEQTLRIWSDDPRVTEVITDPVKPARYAQASGEYDKVFKRLNDPMSGRATE